jgi:hypothetical protein
MVIGLLLTAAAYGLGRSAPRELIGAAVDRSCAPGS